MNRVREAAEKAKIELIYNTGNRHQPSVYNCGRQRAKAFPMKITRAKLDELIKPLIERMRQAGGAGY